MNATPKFTPGPWGRYDDLHFVCDSCCDAVCPSCAGLGERDVDDPMPKVAACPACVKEAA